MTTLKLTSKAFPEQTLTTHTCSCLARAVVGGENLHHDVSCKKSHPVKSENFLQKQNIIYVKRRDVFRVHLVKLAHGELQLMI